MSWLQTLLQHWHPGRPNLTDQIWVEALRTVRYASALPSADQLRLRQLAARFMADKTFSGAQGLVLNPAMTGLVALRACIPVLNLGLEPYDDWQEIIIYPGDFRARHEIMTDDGVIHEGWQDLCGESQEQGPLILSWQSLVASNVEKGHDLVIHECAHKLDILNGAANGYPPLHAEMSPELWARTFTEAYERMNRQLDCGEETALDSYAASAPAEYFAVASEAFFTAPRLLKHNELAVYDVLSQYYRQNPVALL